MTYLPHDLVQIDIDGLKLQRDCPAWVLPSLKEHPWAVVRRAIVDDHSYLPIGVRGSDRSKRFATVLPNETVLERVTPEMLTKRITDGLQAHPIMAIAALPNLKTCSGDYRWGPVGSVGFFLATGADCVSNVSDLDLILRCEPILPLRAAKALADALYALTPRADLLLETPWALCPERVCLVIKSVHSTDARRTSTHSGACMIGALLFPGQGSQRPNMLDFVADDPSLQPLVEDINSVLGIRVAELDTSAALSIAKMFSWLFSLQE